MKIATTIGDMYAFAQSPAEAVKLFQESGFRYLDYSFSCSVSNPNDPLLSDNWKEEIYARKHAADELGFTFVQAHAPLNAARGEGSEKVLLATIRSIEACGILGIKNMVIHSGSFPECKYPDDQLAYSKTIEPFFRALIPAMERHNVHILFENTTIKHCADGMYFPILARDLNALVEYMAHPLFGAAWDVGHAHMDGIDHYTQIMELGQNLKAIHVHDNNGQLDQHTAPFCGTLDYDSLMKGLIDSGYQGYFTLESGGFFRRRRGETLSGPLATTPLDVKKAALSMLYTISKSILTEYGVFEV